MFLRALPFVVLVVVFAPAGQRAGGAPTVKRVTVPWVVGHVQAAARAALRKKGLRVRVVRVRSLKAVGIVVAERPKAGTRVARGTLVRIAVSRGPGP